MDSSPGKADTQPSLPPSAGVKRKAPSLLPAFEPYSSSPGFPRALKRQAVHSPTQQDAAYEKYPTPIPSSTTGILSSSPPLRVQTNRPRLQRTLSTVSERAPLAAVRSVSLPENGDEVLMGRSSNSSHIQLSSNRLISRVHIKARYVPTALPKPSKVEIVCCGWNGAKVHCQGQTHELAKEDTFTSSIQSAEIMLDVQDARIRVQWPSYEHAASESEETDSSWDDETSPTTCARRRVHQLSPLPANVPRLFRAESPTPVGPSNKSFQSFLTETSEKSVLQIYEDHSSPKDQSSPVKAERSQASTQTASQLDDLNGSQLSELSEQDDSDPDEENDPIIHSFGPFGANISARMASFTAGASPLQTRGRFSQDRLSPIPSGSPLKRFSSESTRIADADLMINHVVNQLAFSRLSSTPVSVILNNLPASLKVVGSPSRIESHALTRDDLRKLLVATPCIGEIHREGKDAAGKPLESEYYYIPDEDQDAQRRAAVVDGLRKPSLRNCRKQHKQYYWKKPKTP